MNYEAALINVALLWLLTTPHEFAHAWVATKLGDDTPRREGRNGLSVTGVPSLSRPAAVGRAV